MIIRRRNSIKSHKSGLRGRNSARCLSNKPTVGKAYSPTFRSMSIDEMLDLSNELTQYSRGLIAYSDCSSLAQKCLKTNSQQAAKIVLAELNKQIVMKNRLEYASGYTAVKDVDKPINRYPRIPKAVKKGMTSKRIKAGTE